MNIWLKSILITFCCYLILNNSCLSAESVNDAHKTASYSYMYESVYDKKIFYKNQINAILNKNINMLPKTEYAKIANNQNKLLLYEQALKKGENKILIDTTGIMFQTFAEHTLMSLYKTNFEILSILYYDKTEQQNYDTDKFLCDIQQDKLDNLLKTIKNNLPSEEYKKIILSQKAWKIYVDNTKNLLQDKVKDDKTKRYVIYRIYDNRINALQKLLMLWY